MIALLTGRVIHNSFTEIIIDVQGVGYQVAIPMSTYDKLPKENETVTLHIHTHVREDALTLFGFHSKEEKELFLILTGVSGVGPKLGLTILSSLPVSALYNAIADSNVEVLKRISGIGKKTAERLIVELRDKVSKLNLSRTTSTAADDSEQSAEVVDAILGLEQLGFKVDRIQKVMKTLLKELPKSDQTGPNLIRKGLQLLNK
jgi:Holliday junction DNA helicase RuvA